MPPEPDLTEFYKLSRPRRRPCPVKPALEALTPEQVAQFDAACKVDPGVITPIAVEKWLASKAGDRWIGNWQNVQAHRYGKCTCND